MASLHDRVEEILARAGLAAGPVRSVEPLTGGVSSDVYRVELDRQLYCIKFALPTLRTTVEWTAPVRRSAAEHAWLAFVGARFPGFVPHVHAYDPNEHAIVMDFLPPERHPNWKSRLLARQLSSAFAREVGTRLAAIHAASATAPGLDRRFANAADFEALRIDPYFRFTASREPNAAGRLLELAERLGAARIALVHGDVSPKNILCGLDGPVFIDAECATFGDPAFDCAFCLNHLLIKSIAIPQEADALRSAAWVLWDAYRSGVAWESAGSIEGRVAALLPALMLARVSGKSPVEYLSPDGAAELRARALALIAAAPSSVAKLLQTMERHA